MRLNLRISQGEKHGRRRILEENFGEAKNYNLLVLRQRPPNAKDGSQVNASQTRTDNSSCHERPCLTDADAGPEVCT